MGSLLALSWENLFQVALVAGLSCGVFLAGAAAGWHATCGVAKRIMCRWSRSPTQATPDTGELQRLISGLSELASLVDSAATASRSASSGSSNSNNGAPHTSTPSAPTSSPATGSPAPGSKSSDRETSAIYVRAVASNPYAADEPGPSFTPKSTLLSRIKRPCRLCLKIRGLVGGGESSEPETRRELPQSAQKPPLPMKPRKGSSESPKKPSKRREKGARRDSSDGSTLTSGSSTTGAPRGT